MRGRFCTQPFLVEKQTRYPLSPRRFPSPAPLGESIAPSSAPVCALGHLWFMVASPGPDRTVPRTVRPPRGRLWRWEGPFPSTKPTLPSPPSRWAGRYGRWFMGRRPGKKRRRTPAGSSQLEKVGPGRKNLFLPGVLSSGFLPKKAGLPRGRRRGTHVAGSTLQRFQRNCLPMTEAPRPHLAACGQVPSGKWAQKPPRPVGVWGA